MDKRFWVYIMASHKNGTLYIGVTSDLAKRVWEHKNDKYDGFPKRYDCKLLVYFEDYNHANDAIEREKQMKGLSRQKKLALIEDKNPFWNDLNPGF